MTDLYDAQNKRAVLEVVLETEVDLADVLARFRIIDIHVNQGDGPALQESFLQHTHRRYDRYNRFLPGKAICLEISSLILEILSARQENAIEIQTEAQNPLKIRVEMRSRERMFANGNLHSKM